MKKSSITTIIKNVRQKFPSLTPDSDRFNTYVILLASAQVGPNIKRVAQFTGIPRVQVAQRAKNLRANGIWSGSQVLGNWDSKSGSLELKFDAAAAEGTMNRAEKTRTVLFG